MDLAMFVLVDALVYIDVILEILAQGAITRAGE
jgi:hypothetical protein